MNRFFKALLFTALFTSVSTHTHAEVVHQLAAIDSAGTVVVIENSGTEHWQVVFEGILDNCWSNYSDNSNDPARNTFHQPLGNNQFAFGCTNGYVFIGENGQPIEPVQLPTSYWSWYVMDCISGFGCLWKPSPVFMVFSKELNNTFGKNWLFVAQQGNPFIIDINTRQLHITDGWSKIFGYSDLQMGKNLKDIDYTLPMAGFDIFKDKQDHFHLLGALDLPSKKTKKTQLLIQSLPLTAPASSMQWKTLNPILVELEKDPFYYASDKFKCDTGRLPPHFKQHLPKICNWPDNLPAPPSPRELKGLTGSQPQLDHYHSYITFERTPDNTDDTVRKRTNENAFSREDL